MGFFKSWFLLSYRRSGSYMWKQNNRTSAEKERDTGAWPTLCHFGEVSIPFHIIRVCFGCSSAHKCYIVSLYSHLWTLSVMGRGAAEGCRGCVHSACRVWRRRTHTYQRPSWRAETCSRRLPDRQWLTSMLAKPASLWNMARGSLKRPPLFSCCLLPDFLFLRMEAFAGVSILLASRMVIRRRTSMFVSRIDGWMNSPRALSDQSPGWLGQQLL